MATQELCQKSFEAHAPLNVDSLKKINMKGPEFVPSTRKEFSWIDGSLCVTGEHVAQIPALRIAPDCAWQNFEAPRWASGGLSSVSSGLFDVTCHDLPLESALEVLNYLHHQEVGVPTHTFLLLLERCIEEKDAIAGRKLHRLIVKNRLESDSLLGTRLVRMFASFDSLPEANRAFSNICEPNIYSWDAIICANAKLGQNEQAIELYHEMQRSNVRPDSNTFLTVLKANADSGSLTEGRLIHSDIIQSGFESDVLVGNELLKTYAKCGSVEDMRVVFDRLTNPGVWTWNAIVEGYCQHGSIEEALQLFNQMLQTGVEPDKVTFTNIVRACSSRALIKQGKFIHAHITESGFEVDTIVGSSLMDMYCKSGNLEDARLIFDCLPTRDVVSWNALITGYVQYNHCQEALHLFQELIHSNVQPDNVTFVCVLKACLGMGSLEQGRQLHSHIIALGFESVLSVSTTLIDVYAKCGSLKDASTVFERLPERDGVTWNVLLAGYGQHGHSKRAFQMFQYMRELGIQTDKVTCNCILKTCSNKAALEQGKQMHSHIIDLGLESDLTVGIALTDMYTKCGHVDDAQILFDRLQKHDVVMWSVLIAGYADHGHGQEALQLFQEMQERGLVPDHVMFICILKVCSRMSDSKQGNHIHSLVVECGFALDLFVGSALVDMYTKFGSLEEARIAFQKLQGHDVVTWSALIAGYVQHGHGKEAHQLFQLMQEEGLKPDQVTFICMMKACSNSSSLDKGKWLHALTIESGFELDVFVGNTLIDMYGKCGGIKDAHIIFDKLPFRDIVTWNAMIAGYGENESEQQVLQLFHQMLQEDMMPDKVTCICVLKACSRLAALHHGKWVQANIIGNGLESDLFVGSALIDMYSKCGCLEDACNVFDRWPKRDVVTWSAMIGAYVQHGEYTLASQCFQEMQQTGLKPNDVTFLSLLTACSRFSLVDEGCSHFKSMREKHGIVPIPEHYSSMTDLLGHTGYIKEAEDLLETMPFTSNIAAWTSLLGSCKKHGNLEVGRKCFDYITRMDPGNATAHILMANIYAQADMREDVEKMEHLRRYANAWKKPAKAFIEINDQVHGFIVGDRSHPQSKSIYSKLKDISMKMRSKGYQPSLDFQDSMSDEYMNDTLCGHCERLAIAFGLICTPQGTTIRVTKNLRVCTECHGAAKAISKFELREIIVTDSYCIHHFKDGSCSCKH